MILRPGIYEGIDEATYHQGTNTPSPSLSQSSIKRLIPPSTPAHFKAGMVVTSSMRRAFDVGSAAHSYVLGVGETMHACPAEYLSSVGSMTTTKAKAWAAEIRAIGGLPLTPSDHQTVLGMASALADHPRVAEILTDPDKRPEVSIYAQDPESFVWLRGRFDVLGGGLWDYKTSVSAEPEHFRKAAWSYGYHIQDAMYRWMYELVTGEETEPMTFIVQEKTAPYLPAVYQLDGDFHRVAMSRIRDAIDLYVRCSVTDYWPGYPAETITLTPPTWALREFDSGPVPLDPTFASELEQLAKGFTA